jgi:hypothetical protein
MTRGPIHDLSAFTSALRGNGLVVTPDQTADMAVSLTIVDPASRAQVHAALQSLTVTDPAQRETFDQVFDQFFAGLRMPRIAEQHSSTLSAASTATTPLLKPVDHERSGDVSQQSGTSSVETVANRDFADLDAEELEQARRLVASMFWRPTDTRTRRWTPDNHGRRPDLRRTLHSATGPTGDLMQVRFRERKHRQRPLIVMADISGSMERYAELFLVFAHAARRRLRHVEIFTFSTRLTRITEEMSRRDTRSALTLVNNAVSDWSGGTMIGDALAVWNKQWSRRMARGGPVVLILSDGWDCGDPELLGLEMGRLSRSVHQVMWLNPLAGHLSYRPATRGMRVALPHVDHFLPAASVNDLRDVVRLLESINGRRSR